MELEAYITCFDSLVTVGHKASLQCQEKETGRSHSRQGGQKGMEGAMEGGRKKERKEEMGIQERRKE